MERKLQQLLQTGPVLEKRCGKHILTEQQQRLPVTKKCWNETEKTCSVSEIELLTVAWGSVKRSAYLWGKTKQSECQELTEIIAVIRQYGLTSWHFLIMIPHTAENNSKFTELLNTVVILIIATTLMHKSTLSSNNLGNNHFGQK